MSMTRWSRPSTTTSTPAASPSLTAWSAPQTSCLVGNRSLKKLFNLNFHICSSGSGGRVWAGWKGVLPVPEEPWVSFAHFYCFGLSSFICVSSMMVQLHAYIKFTYFIGVWSMSLRLTLSVRFRLAWMVFRSPSCIYVGEIAITSEMSCVHVP